LDETIERRWGRRIAARGIYRDAARSSKAVTNKTSGLRWLSVQLLARVRGPTNLGPAVLTALAPSARYYQARGRQPQSLTARAKQVILQVKRWAPKRVPDLYGGSCLRSAGTVGLVSAPAVTLIVPCGWMPRCLRPPPSPVVARRASRLKGRRLPTLAARLKDRRIRWQRCWVNWYGRGRTKVEVTTGTALWYHSAKCRC